MTKKVEKVWQVLFAHEAEIYGYIKSSIGDGEAARDLYQDVFLSAIQHLNELNTERSLKNWLYTVARNRVINHLKSNKRRQTVELSEHHAIGIPTDQLDTNLIQRIFLKINPVHRQVLLWHLHEGYSYEEIAEKLNRSVSAVTSLIHRARENFQYVYLQEFLPEDLAVLPDLQDVMRFIDPLIPAPDLFERIEKKALAYFSVLNRQWDKIRTAYLDEDDLSAVLDKMILPRDARVADLGSGTGFVSIACASKGYQVFAVDKNASMTGSLAASRNDLTFSNIHVMQSDIRFLPLRDEILEAVFFTLVLHHLANPVEALINSLRHVKSGGYLVVIDFFRHIEKELADTMHDLWLGFDPRVIEKHLKKSGAKLITAGAVKRRSPIRSFYQIFQK